VSEAPGAAHHNSGRPYPHRRAPLVVLPEPPEQVPPFCAAGQSLGVRSWRRGSGTCLSGGAVVEKSPAGGDQPQCARCALDLE